MDNGDATQGHAMTPEEFAKLMGAYPQPAENPLPTYGGYMDNSPANFSFVEFNDYFGAETFETESDWHSLKIKLKEQQAKDEAKRMEKQQNLKVIKDNIKKFDEWLQKNLKEGQNIQYRLQVAKDDDLISSGIKSGDYFYEIIEPNDIYFMMIPGQSINDNERLYQPNEMLKNWQKEFIEFQIPMAYWNAETFEAPYAGAGSLFSIGQNTGLEGFTTSELTTSSAIHGDFDEASLNYSGHQNFEVRAETKKGWSCKYCGHNLKACLLQPKPDPLTLADERCLRCGIDADFDGDGKTVEEWKEFAQNMSFPTDYDAEMEMIDDSNARIRNRFGDEIGMVAVDDHDVEDAVVEVSDGSDMIQEVIISEAETKKSSMIPLALGAVAAIFAFPKVSEFLTKKELKEAETPELIENPNTGNLDPAQYEEMVVESTGYAVDVIPQVLDGSFMGSRFAALPTERYVEYNEGIGAHTDIALNRDEMYLEPEMAMVQASENVIKESQAPGQSPYNSMTGEENPDFDMRVIKETTTVSLDPAVKPFIPQSMSGYTGNANTPPSVMNKMFNIGVLGQTPSFVPGSGDIGANHLGSRNATPNTLGLNGSVGGPLSDQVNSNYTDGTTSMSLAQWSIENTVSQTSDTEAVVIDRSSGAMKRVRRV